MLSFPCKFSDQCLPFSSSFLSIFNSFLSANLFFSLPFVCPPVSVYDCEMNRLVKLLFLLGFTWASDDFVIVDTKLGNLKGFRHQIDENHRADVFLSIPYAEPPLGDLRFEVGFSNLVKFSFLSFDIYAQNHQVAIFQKPQPLERWEGVLDATHFGPSCYPHAAEGLLPPQFSNYSEDCLTLNIMRPSRLHSVCSLPLSSFVVFNPIMPSFSRAICLYWFGCMEEVCNFYRNILG